MDAPHLARILRRRWVLIMIAVVFTLTGAGLVTARATPVYVAESRLYVSSTGGGPEAALAGDQLALQRIASYVAIADSPLVAEKVIDRLDLELEPQQLAGQVTATSSGVNLIVDISVRDTSPERARDVANALGPELDEAVNELENTTRAKALPIKVTILRPAQLPEEPVSPQPVRNLGLALALGLMLGLGSAALREILDTTIRGGELEELVHGAPALGNIPLERAVRKDPIAVVGSPRSRFAEAFRQLRTNLRFVDVGRASKTFVITSAVAGEGKSVVSCNLAAALAQSGSRVCLVEGDLRRPRLSEYLGIDNVPGLSSVLGRLIPLEDALQSGGDGLFTVLPSGPPPPNPSELLGSTQMQEVVEDLRGRFEFVIFDTPPLLPVTDAAVLARLTDGALLVVGLGRTRRQQVRQAHRALTTVEAILLGTVVNVLRGRQSVDDDYYGYTYRPAGQGRPERHSAHPVTPATGASSGSSARH